jgi:hypothetical protein
LSDFNDYALLFPGRELRGHDSTASRSSTRSAGSKRRRWEFEEVIPSIEEHDTPPPLGSAQNPFPVSSDSDDSDDSESSDDNESYDDASSPNRRRIHIVAPEYSPITPLRQTFNSISDNKESYGDASSPNRRHIVAPEYSPITPLQQTSFNSVSDSQRRVRGPTTESGVKDEEE